MPAFLAAIGVIIIEYLIKGIIWLVKRLLVAFGVGVIAYVGIQPFIDYLIRVVVDLIVTNDTYQIAAWLGVMRFGECASVMLSALSYALIMRFKDRIQFTLNPSKYFGF